MGHFAFYYELIERIKPVQNVWSPLAGQDIKVIIFFYILIPYFEFTFCLNIFLLTFILHLFFIFLKL